MATGSNLQTETNQEWVEPTIAQILDELDLPNGPSYPELLRRLRSFDPAGVAVEFEDEVIDRRELLSRVAGAATWLEQHGVTRGTHVAYMFLGHPQALVTQLAVHLVGAILVPVYPEFTGSVLRGVLTRLDVSYIVVHPERLNAVREAAGDVSGLTIVEGIDSEYDKAALAGADIDPFLARNYPTADDDALIMSTSGTTGLPKGVLLKHSFAAGGYINARKLQIPLPVKDYLASSWGHGGPLVQSSMSFWSGGSVVIARKFSASHFWDDIRRYRCTHFNLFGTMPQMLLAQPPRDNDREHHVEDATVAGMSQEVWSAFSERFGVRVCVPLSAIDSGGMYVGNPGRYPVGSCGRPWVDFDARLIDDNGNDVPVGTPGELLMRPKNGAPVVRYYNDPESSAEKTRGGWTHFGDVLKQDDDGNFWFVDRKRDVIRRRGVNIAPAAIEEALKSIDAVEEAAAVAVPSELGEDDVKIVVVLAADHAAEPHDIVTAGLDVLPPHMRPRYVELAASLPKTPTARVKRYELRTGWRTAATWDSQTEEFLKEQL